MGVTVTTSLAQSIKVTPTKQPEVKDITLDFVTIYKPDSPPVSSTNYSFWKITKEINGVKWWEKITEQLESKGEIVEPTFHIDEDDREGDPFIHRDEEVPVKLLMRWGFFSTINPKTISKTPQSNHSKIAAPIP